MLAQAGALVGLIRRGFPLIPLSRRILPTISTKDINGFYSSTGDDHENKSEQLKHLGKKLDDILYGEPGFAREIEKKSIFCNNRINLGEIEVYGFDYDYTLARYTKELNDVIYDEALNNLVHHYNYPKELLTMEKKLKPIDVIRGLHFDTKTGFLMKINAYQNILPYTVYRLTLSAAAAVINRGPVGLQEVNNVEEDENFDGLHIKNDEIIPSRDNFGRPRMRQMVDIFSNSEAAVLGTVVEFFSQNEYQIDNELLFRDCQDAIKRVHVSGKMSSIVEMDFERYLNRNDKLREFLTKLQDNGKKLFILTNSGYDFMNKGMKHMLDRDDWMDLFEVVVTNCQKPSFYQQQYRPFRLLDENGKKTWGKVEKFHKGRVYAEGNVTSFMDLANFPNRRKVLYFGDHILNDLVGPVTNPGWRTGAIMHDLEDEITAMNKEQFRKNRKQLDLLHPYIQDLQRFMGENESDGHEYEEVKRMLKLSEDKREKNRADLKDAINPKFGSVFRSFGSSSFFNRRLIRFADIYTSRVENLLYYPLDVTLYSR